nr:hypothetical protein StreXyl84_39250 [Streptomyces sp. Xyl84]
MADGNLIAALPARAAHPLAKPGYGKRSAPDQAPPRAGDFDRLPARAAYLANLIDRLDENAAMDAKTLAKAQPLYGQQAVRSALNELSAAGHLRRVRRRVAPVGPQAPSVPPALMECTDCRVPGRPEALRGGLCRACRDGSGAAPPVSRAPVRAQALAAAPAPGHLPPHTVRARAAAARAAIRRKKPETCGKNLLT